MPGFNIAPFGGGFNNNGPSNNTETRRKHRWVFETLGRGSGTFSQTELLLLQSASRPAGQFEEVEMHHNQEVAKYAGKSTWEPMTLTWYDAEQQPDISAGIYQWIETVVNQRSISVAHPRFYKRTASLAMLNGAGAPTETWSIMGTWPKSWNYQELDYTSNEIQTVEVVMFFDRAIRARLDGSCTTIPTPVPNVPSC